ncbi:membrane protein [soil metagenome]
MRCRWMLSALGRNPLVRVSDRVEALAVLMVFVVAALAIPMASQAGDEVYDARMRIIDEQLRTRHPVQAVAVSGSGSTPVRYTRPGPVRAEWREGSETRSEVVNSAIPVNPGAKVTVWLDNTGKVVTAPETPQVARSVAAGRTWTLWLGAVVTATLMAYASRRLLDCSRTRSWERELLVLAHNDDGWADRHS